MQRLFPQPASATVFTGRLRQVVVQSRLDILTIGVVPPSLQVGDHALEMHAVFTLIAIRGAVHQNASDRFGKLLVRRIGINIEVLAELADEPAIVDVHPLAVLTPGLDRALG